MNNPATETYTLLNNRTPREILTNNAGAVTRAAPPVANTSKNSFQNVCFSALSLLTPAQSRENRIAL